MCRGSLSKMVSVQGGGPLSRGSLSEGVSIQGSLCRGAGVLCQGDVGRYASYWNAFLLVNKFTSVASF